MWFCNTLGKMLWQKQKLKHMEVHLTQLTTTCLVHPVIECSGGLWCHWFGVTVWHKDALRPTSTSAGAASNEPPHYGVAEVGLFSATPFQSFSALFQRGSRGSVLTISIWPGDALDPPQGSFGAVDSVGARSWSSRSGASCQILASAGRRAVPGCVQKNPP